MKKTSLINLQIHVNYKNYPQTKQYHFIQFDYYNFLI